MHTHHPCRLPRVAVDHFLTTAGDPCIVHQDVHRTEVTQHVITHPLHVVAVLDRGGIGVRASPHRLDLLDGGTCGLLVAAVVDRHVRAGARQLKCDRSADAAAAARDQGHATGQ
jgi:hypothetical protein